MKNKLKRLSYFCLILGLLAQSGCNESHQNLTSDKVDSSTIESRATYQLTFKAVMDDTVATGVHLTKFVGVTHKNPGVFWLPGGFSSEGLRLIAERGNQNTAISELGDAVISGDAEFVIIGQAAIWHPKNLSNSSQYSHTFQISKNHPYLSLASMIGPSPDWFVGIHDELLLQDDQFIPSANYILYAYTAGTKNKNPHIKIARITDPAISGIAYGTLTLTKL